MSEPKPMSLLAAVGQLLICVGGMMLLLPFVAFGVLLLVAIFSS